MSFRKKNFQKKEKTYEKETKDNDLKQFERI